MKYLIYKITNNVNGKIYIGKHKTENLDDRYFGSGTRLRNAIKKYGIENFTFHLEFELQNEEELNLLENLVVNEDFVKRTDTYNLRVGGEGGNLSDETKKKISDALKGIPKSEEHKKKISEANKCENHPMFNKHLSEYTRNKLSDALKGIPKSEEHKKKISEASKNRSEEHKKKISEARKGVPRSEETRKKISVSLKGKKKIKQACSPFPSAAQF